MPIKRLDEVWVVKVGDDYMGQSVDELHRYSKWDRYGDAEDFRIRYCNGLKVATKVVAINKAKLRAMERDINAYRMDGLEERRRQLRVVSEAAARYLENLANNKKRSRWAHLRHEKDARGYH